MLIETPKLLPDNLDMLCYACEDVPATHLCRYQVGELVIQVCLCESCMKIDTKRLLENTVGIQGLSKTYHLEGLKDNDMPCEGASTGHPWMVRL